MHAYGGIASYALCQLSSTSIVVPVLALVFTRKAGSVSSMEPAAEYIW